MGSEVDGWTGLTSAEAAARLAADGPNELPRAGQRSFFDIVRDVLKEPMLLLLLGAGAVYLALGDRTEAIILLAFACLSIVITIVQEARTEHALEALRDLTSPRALVVRDGARIRIAGRDVVCGDLVVLSEGDRVPADGWLCAADNLHADESLLTGESIPVRKTASLSGPPEQTARPGGDDLPFVYSGSLIVRGSGLCIVAATGAASEIGRIGGLLSGLETEAPRLARETRRLVLWAATLGMSVSVLAAVLYGLFRGDWLQAALAGIALGMSMLPEEFPVVLAVFLAMGAMRMSRVRVLARRAAAIETLGAATVLCTDKTGTLTENSMRIAQLRLPDGAVTDHRGGDGDRLGAEFTLLAEYGILASAPQPVDPMEIAFHALGEAEPAALMPRQQSGWRLLHHYPLDPALLAMSHVWQGGAEGEPHVVASKGAPEAIADLCRLEGAARQRVLNAASDMAAQGLRVLGVADARWAEDAALPPSQRDFSFTFRGLVGLADPLRSSVPDAVQQCRSAGIRVVMVTGDYPQTALAIARQAGIDASVVLSGDELAQLDDATLAARLRDVCVFARIMPEQKLRIVNALKADGEIVAMTGDGVNDAPSLKAAHIGVAMGGRGTDVAREAAAIVLLDDDFGSIVKAVRLGRRIYDNLRKAMGFILAVHIPIAGLALLPLLTGMPILLGPLHIAFLEMIIDPVCSLAFEAEREERDVMRRPPRGPDAPIVSRNLAGWSFVQGLLVMAGTGGFTFWSWQQGHDAAELRAIAFVGLILGVFMLILVNRRFGSSLGSALGRRNTSLFLVAFVVAAVLALVQAVPAVARVFKLSALDSGHWLMLGLFAGATLIALEAMKRFFRKGLFA